MINKRTSSFLLLLTIFVISLGFFFIHHNYAFAQGENIVNGLDEFGGEVNLSDTDPRIIIARVIRIILGFLGIVGLAVILYGGFLYMTSGGAEQAVEKAKKWLINGVIGMVIILSAFAITSFVIGSLSDATGFTNGSNDNDDGGGGGNGGGSGYTVNVIPTGENNPPDSRVKVSFPFGQLPLSLENAESNITVVNVTGVGEEISFSCPDLKAVGPGEDGYMGGFIDDACNAVPGCYWEGNFKAGACYSEENNEIGGPALGCADFTSSLTSWNNEVQDNARLFACANPCVFDDQISNEDTCSEPQPAEISEIAGSFELDGRKVVFTPDAACPDTCGSESCFPTNSDFEIRIANLMNSNNEIINCAAGGYCKVVDFSTSDICDVDEPALAIDYVIPEIVQEGTLFDVDTFGRDDSGLVSMKLCPTRQSGSSDICEEYEPSESQKEIDYIFNGFDAGGTSLDLDLGWHFATLYGEDLSGKTANVDKKYLVASEACFDESGEFDCTLPDCEVPCEECDDPNDCEYYCEEEGGCQSWPFPIIDSVLPQSGAKGSFVTISGRNFENFGENSRILINGVEAPMACGSASGSWNDRQVVVQVPETATGPIRLYDRDGYYNDTGDNGSPGWKGSFEFESGESDWIGLCSVENKDGVSGSEGQPGDYAKAVGENIGDEGRVYFNGILVNYNAWGPDNIIDNIKVPNVAVGRSRVQLGRGTVNSNPVNFYINSLQNNLNIDSVSPENGPQKQYVTIKGNNFGLSGSVSFVSGTDVYLAEQPCNGGWNENEIIIQVPEDIPNGNYTLQVSGDEGTDSVDFVINDNFLTPGICSLNPNNGPAGTPLKISGVGFSDDYAEIEFTGVNGTTVLLEEGTLLLDNVDWSDEFIGGVKVPPTAATGNMYVIVDGRRSNPARFDFGKCSGDDSCGEGRVCCQSSYCSLIDECEIEYSNSEYGWYFTTGVIPQVPKVIERECILGQYDESTSPSKNEQNACPNSKISVTFNMQMLPSSFNDKNIIIKRCQNPGEQCNFDNCSDPAAGCHEDEYSLNQIDTGYGGDEKEPIFSEWQDSTYLSREVTQLVLDYNYDEVSGNLGADYWYEVTVPAGVQAINEEFETVELMSDYTWMFHTGNDDCTLASVLVNPAEGVIEEIYETQKYKASGQAANCAILDVSGYAWAWTLDKYNDKLEKASIADEPNNEATYKIKNGIANAETVPGDPARVRASAIIGGTSKSDTANLSAIFKDPRVIKYWPDCGEACTNAEVGMLLNTYMKKDEIFNNPSLVQLYKCDDQNCESIKNQTNTENTLQFISEATPEINCDSTTGIDTVMIGDEEVEVCNRIRIMPAAPLEAAKYYRPLLIEDVHSISNKTLSGLNFSSVYEKQNTCGNSLIEPTEQCEATCKDEKGDYCEAGSDGCDCSLANNPYCDNDCQFKNIPMCTATQQTRCCGNGVIENYADGFEFSTNDFLINEEFYTAKSVENNGWDIEGAVTFDHRAEFVGSGRLVKDIRDMLTDKEEMTFYVRFQSNYGLTDDNTYYFYDTAPSDQRFYLLKHGASNEYRLQYRFGNNQSAGTVSLDKYQDYWNEGGDNMFIFTTDGNVVDGYLNGNVIYSSTKNLEIDDFVSNLYVGASSSNNFFFNGSINSFGILGRYFSQNDIDVINNNEFITEQCEGTCLKVGERQFVGVDPLTACNDYLTGLDESKRVSTSCSCTNPTTCDDGDKVCASYCKEDITRSCYGSAPGCTCVEPQICNEAFENTGEIEYCAETDLGCSCQVDMACRAVDGSVGATCSESDTSNCLEGEQCRAVGTYQFSPDIQCFNDNLDDDNLGKCVKLSHCSEDGEVCSEDRDACNCVSLNLVSDAECPTDDLICDYSCSIKEKVNCEFGDEGCVCNLPSECKSCLYPNIVTEGVESIFDAFSWVFKTREGTGLCQPNNINVSPATYIATIAGDDIGYSATPYAEPDVCSPDGQQLNANFYDWQWSAEPSDRAFISNRNNPYDGSTDKLINIFTYTYRTEPAEGCSGTCLNEGGQPYTAVCGNGVVEKGEECDTGGDLTNASCDKNCLNAGTNPCYGETVNQSDAICCGNGQVNYGEECDGEEGCSANCLHAGSGVAGFVCGNGVREAGEDADYGDNNLKYGLDSNCLYTGSDFPINNEIVYAGAICGNGTVEQGEECEPILTNCVKYTDLGAGSSSPEPCNPNDSSDDRCVCEDYEDQYCDVDCTIKNLPQCGTQKVCQENNAISCTDDVAACNCVKTVGEVEGFCDENGDGDKDDNEVTACVVSADECTCIDKVIDTNCCGNGVIDTINYQEAGQSRQIIEECEALTNGGQMNCYKPAPKAVCSDLNYNLYFSMERVDGGSIPAENSNEEIISDNIEIVDGVRGKSLSFNGNSYGTVSDDFDFGKGDAAISMWLKVDNEMSGIRYILSNLEREGSSYLKGTYSLAFYNGKLRFYYINNSAGFYGLSGNKNVVDNKWHHVVINFDRDDKISIYIDGILDIALPGYNVFDDKDLDFVSQLTLGARKNISSYYLNFEGGIDELKLFNRLLNIKEIEGQYNGCRDNNATTISCNFGEEGCVCEDPAWCNGCLNVGSSSSYETKSFCGDGEVGLGEDALCEAGASGDSYTAAFAVNNVLGYLPYGQRYEDLLIRASIVGDTLDQEYSGGIYGDGEFRYTYTGFGGPPPEGCGLDDYPEASLISPTAGKLACRNSMIIVDFDQEVSSAHVAGLTQEQKNDFVRLEYMGDSCAGEQTGLLHNTLNKIVQGVKSFVSFFTGRNVNAAQWCAVENYDVTVTKNSDDNTRLEVNLNGQALNIATYRVIVEDLEDPCGQEMAAQELTFNVSSDFCRVNSVAVSPNPKFTSKAGDEWEINHYAMSSGTALAPVAGLYEWMWHNADGNEWVVQDSDLLEFLQIEDNPTTYEDETPDLAKVGNISGATVISSTATIIVDNTNSQLSGATTGTEVVGSGVVDIFICDNPWYGDPGADGWPEATDSATANEIKNVRLRYCRDAGEMDDFTDDLPELKVIAAPTDLIDYDIVAGQCSDGADNDGDGLIDFDNYRNFEAITDFSYVGRNNDISLTIDLGNNENIELTHNFVQTFSNGNVNYWYSFDGDNSTGITIQPNVDFEFPVTFSEIPTLVVKINFHYVDEANPTTSDIEYSINLEYDRSDPDCGSADDDEYPDNYGSCQDGIDNDFDGKIDAQDSECAAGLNYESKATMLAQYYFLRDSADVTSDGSGDAIALRVYTNPELLSARDWYGRYVPNVTNPNPSDVSFGCFEDAFYRREVCYYGVRDGNTVYISAGNKEGNNLYNYIYVLAYSLGSNSVTTNIFSQMLTHVTFNNNLDTVESEHWAIKRDIKRLNDVTSIKNMLIAHYQANGSLPELAGGTYIRGITISSWPSWQAELGTALNRKLPIDPINYFEQYYPESGAIGTVCGAGLYCRSLDDQCVTENGRCSVCAPGASVDSCWNNETTTFGMAGPNDVYNTFSALYQYQYISFNAGQLYYQLEGELSGYYTIPQKPNSSIYFDVQ